MAKVILNLGSLPVLTGGKLDALLTQQAADQVSFVDTFANIKTALRNTADWDSTSRITGKNVDTLVIADTLTAIKQNAAAIKTMVGKLTGINVVVALSLADAQTMVAATDFATTGPLYTNAIGAAASGTTPTQIWVRVSEDEVGTLTNVNTLKLNTKLKGFLVEDTNGDGIVTLTATDLFAGGTGVRAAGTAKLVLSLDSMQLISDDVAVPGLIGSITTDDQGNQHFAISSQLLPSGANPPAGNLLTKNGSVIDEVRSSGAPLTFSATAAQLNILGTAGFKFGNATITVEDSVTNIGSMSATALASVSAFSFTDPDWYSKSLTFSAAAMTEVVRIAQTSPLYVSKITVADTAANLKAALFNGDASTPLLDSLKSTATAIGNVVVLDVVSTDATGKLVASNNLTLTMAQANALTTSATWWDKRDIQFAKEDTITVSTDVQGLQDLMWNSMALDNFKRANIDSITVTPVGNQTLALDLWQARQFAEKGIALNIATSSGNSLALGVSVWPWEMQTQLTKTVLQKLGAAGLGNLTLKDWVPNVDNGAFFNLNVAQVQNLTSVTGIKVKAQVLTWNDPATPVNATLKAVDTGANIGNLTAAQITAMSSNLGITTIDSTTNSVAVSLAVAKAMKTACIKFAGDDVITISVAKADISSTDLTALKVAGALSANGAVKATVALSMTSKDIKAYADTAMTADLKGKVDKLDASDSGTVALTVLQAKALAAMNIGSNDVMKVQDTVDALNKLTAADIKALLKPASGTTVNFKGVTAIVTTTGDSFNKSLADMKALRTGLGEDFSKFGKAATLEVRDTVANLKTDAGLSGIDELRKTGAPITVSVYDGGTAVSALTVDEIKKMAGKIDQLVINKDSLTLSAAQMAEMIGFDINFTSAATSSAITLKDDAYKLAALKDFQIAAFGAMGVTVADVGGDGNMTLTAAKALKYINAGIKFVDADTIKVKDAGGAISRLEGQDYKALKDSGVDKIELLERTVITKDQADGLLSSKLAVSTTGSFFALNLDADEAASLKAFGSDADATANNMANGDFAHYASIGIREIGLANPMPATNDKLSLNLAQAKALFAYGMKIAPNDAMMGGYNVAVADAGSKLSSLTATDVDKMIAARFDGIKVVGSQDAALSLDVVKKMAAAGLDNMTGVNPENGSVYATASISVMYAFVSDATQAGTDARTALTSHFFNLAIKDSDDNIKALLDNGHTGPGVVLPGIDGDIIADGVQDYIAQTADFAMANKIVVADGAITLSSTDWANLNASGLSFANNGQKVAVAVTSDDLSTITGGDLATYRGKGVNALEVQLGEGEVTSYVSVDTLKTCFQNDMKITGSSDGFSLVVSGDMASFNMLVDPNNWGAMAGQIADLNGDGNHDIADIGVALTRMGVSALRFNDMDMNPDDGTVTFNDVDLAKDLAATGIAFQDAQNIILSVSKTDFDDLSNTDLTSFAGLGIDEVLVTGGSVDLTVSKARNLISTGVRLAVEDGSDAMTGQKYQVSIGDTGANVAKLTSGQLAAIADMGVQTIDINDSSGLAYLSVARAKTFASVGLKFSVGDTVIVSDTEANFKKLDTAAKVAALSNSNIDYIDSLSDSIQVTAAQAAGLASGNIAIVNDDDSSLVDTGANLAANFSTVASRLAKIGVDVVDLSDDAMTTSAKSLLQAANTGVRFAAGDVVTAKDTADILSQLSGSDVGTLINYGVKSYTVDKAAATGVAETDVVSAAVLSAIATQGGFLALTESATQTVKIGIDADTADTVAPDDFAKIVATFAAQVKPGTTTAAAVNINKAEVLGSDARLTVQQMLAAQAAAVTTTSGTTTTTTNYNLLDGLAAKSITLADTYANLKAFFDQYTVKVPAGPGIYRNEFKAVPSFIGGVILTDSVQNLTDINAQAAIGQLGMQMVADRGLSFDVAVKDTAENIESRFADLMAHQNEISEVRLTDSTITLDSMALSQLQNVNFKFAGPAVVKAEIDATMLNTYSAEQVQHLASIGIDVINVMQMVMENGMPVYKAASMTVNTNPMGMADPSQMSATTYAQLKGAGINLYPEPTVTSTVLHASDFKWSGAMATPFISGFTHIGETSSGWWMSTPDTLAYYGKSAITFDFSKAAGVNQVSGDSVVINFENLNAQDATGNVTVTAGMQTTEIRTGDGSDVVKLIDDVTTTNWGWSQATMQNVDTGAGNDRVTGVVTDNDQITLGDGNDVADVTVHKSSPWAGAPQINGGDGIDTVVLKEWTGDAWMGIDLNMGSIAVNDQYGMQVSYNGFESIDLSAAKNGVTVWAKELMSNEMFASEAGHKTSDFLSIKTGSGNDEIHLRGTSYTVKAGAGADDVYASDMASPNSAGSVIDLGQKVGGTALDGETDVVHYENVNSLYGRWQQPMPGIDPDGGQPMTNQDYDIITSFETGTDQIMLGGQFLDLGFGQRNYMTGQLQLRWQTVEDVNTAVDFNSQSTDPTKWNDRTDAIIVKLTNAMIGGTGGDYVELTDANIAKALQNLNIAFNQVADIPGDPNTTYHFGDTQALVVFQGLQVGTNNSSNALYLLNDFNHDGKVIDVDPQGVASLQESNDNNLIQQPEMLKIAAIRGSYISTNDILFDNSHFWG